MFRFFGSKTISVVFFASLGNFCVELIYRYILFPRPPPAA
jgi:hypothetical protein